MPNKLSHKISFSGFPRSFVNTEGKSQRLQWDRRELLQRISFVLKLFCEEPVSMHVEFLDELDMGALNWKFRGKDSATDVLSFPPNRHLAMHHEHSSAEAGLSDLGELAICVPLCRLQARKHRCTLAQELERMIVHGVVHLKGFDHERGDAAYAVMASLEKAIRAQLMAAFGEPRFCQESISSPARATRGVRR